MVGTTRPVYKPTNMQSWNTVKIVLRQLLRLIDSELHSKIRRFAQNMLYLHYSLNSVKFQSELKKILFLGTFTVINAAFWASPRSQAIRIHNRFVNETISWLCIVRALKVLAARLSRVGSMSVIVFPAALRNSIASYRNEQRPQGPKLIYRCWLRHKITNWRSVDLRMGCVLSQFKHRDF